MSMRLIATGVVLVGLIVALGTTIGQAQNYVVEGDTDVVTATTTATAAPITKSGCMVTFVNLSDTPLCTGYDSAMTCGDTGSASINVCGDLTKCVGKLLSRETTAGALYYRVKTGTLANVVVETGRCLR